MTGQHKQAKMHSEIEMKVLQCVFVGIWSYILSWFKVIYRADTPKLVTSPCIFRPFLFTHKER